MPGGKPRATLQTSSNSEPVGELAQKHRSFNIGAGVFFVLKTALRPTAASSPRRRHREPRRSES